MLLAGRSVLVAVRSELFSGRVVVVPVAVGGRLGLVEVFGLVVAAGVLLAPRLAARRSAGGL